MLSIRELRQEFTLNGFVVVPDVLDASASDRLSALLTTALLNRRAQEDKPLIERHTLNRQFTHCYNVWEDHPDIRQFVFDPRICAIAAGLLDAQVIRLFVDQTFFKDSLAEATSRHQDCTRWPVEGKLLTAWIALDDVTEDSGALAYVPGSQAVGPSSWLDLVMGRQWSSDEKALIDRPPIFVPARQGTVIFHDSCTFHLSAPNATGQCRRAFAIAYAADGAVRASHLPYPVLDWDDVQVGQPLGGPRTPVAWPTSALLPDGPPPPPQSMVGWPLPVGAGAS